MALSQKLNLRQSQSLVMTPQLMQSIKLLQLSTIELTAFIENEVEKNPLIEIAQNDDFSSQEPMHAEGDQTSPDPQEWLDTEFSTQTSSVKEQFDTDVDNVFTADGPSAAANVDPSSSREQSSALPTHTALSDQEYDLEAFVEAKLSLVDHLNDQIALIGLNPADRLIAAALVETVDDGGYCRAELDQVAQRLDTDVENVWAVLEVLQGLEPLGVFAQDLCQCLKIQLKDKDRLDPAMELMVDNLDLLAKSDFPAIKRLCKVDAEDLVQMVQEIRALDPKPGTAFSSAPVQAIVPDVSVQQGADGSWHVQLISDSLPKVLINHDYYATITRQINDKTEKQFMTDCLQTANWLTKSLDQRARTILKVATEIVAQQDAFLVHGVEFLRPMNLKQVADAIGMHDSTVSRVTSNKYMLTHRGIFELKYFFTSGVGGAEGVDAHSAEAVKHRIGQLIASETASSVYSDDGLVKALAQDGVDVARRTVAKYREAMGIASSVQRRREKRAMAK